MGDTERRIQVYICKYLSAGCMLAQYLHTTCIHNILKRYNLKAINRLHQYMKEVQYTYGWVFVYGAVTWLNRKDVYMAWLYFFRELHIFLE